MSDQKQARAIGIFTLIALVIMVFGVSLFGSSSFFKNELSFEMIFPGDVKGLSVGAPVTFRGVKVGDVERIEFHNSPNTENQQLNILVIAKFSENNNGFPKIDGLSEFIRQQIELGMAAKLVSGSLVTGTLQIQLEYYNGNRGVTHQSLSGNLVVPTVPSDLQQLTEVLTNFADQFKDLPIGEILENVKDLSASINALTSNEDIGLTLRDLAISAASLRSFLSNIEARSDSMLQKADNLLDNSNQMTSSISQTSDQYRMLAQSGQSSLKELDVLLQSANGAMQELEKQVKPNSNLSVSVIKTMGSVERAANQVRQLSQSLERNPEAIIGGRQR
ncbi:MCE family protein [Alginatibacterium sediminis]|uniref:MCE family protein n=1 Tax=Alginatibacterium sediminis TaxID=2164068 RepID=A0A420EBN4_9ALTE|nr:MlaD family protein [Alginatibacterium sediminis]RKF18099.1 MCE family protein [Alginatibacterium sediminis]